MSHEVAQKRGLRVVVLGDSVAFGYRVPTAYDQKRGLVFDRAERPYPELVEERLRVRFNRSDIEVIPLAVPGYSSSQGLAWLERDVAELKPDAVVASFGWNDLRTAGLPDRVTLPSSFLQILLRRLIASSQFLLHVKGAPSAGPSTPAVAEPRTSDDEYVSNFLKMAEICKREGAWFGILLPVYRDPNVPGIDPEKPQDRGNPDEGRRMTFYRHRLRAEAQIARIPTLEISKLTEGAWPGNRRLFGERIHPNAAGHVLIAGRLAEFLREPLERLQARQ
ncbi:MAG: GDSL-type esterase/lipase family protein [Vicinamibacteria bacterium]